MNENNEEFMESINEESQELLYEEGDSQDGQGIDEGYTETEPGEQQTISEEQSVSQGDSVAESAYTNEVLIELQIINSRLEAMENKHDQEAMTIWEKPLETYTVEESLQLIVVLAILGALIFTIVGGIIRCEI